MTAPGLVARGTITQDHFPTIIQMLASQGTMQSVLCRNDEGQGIINIGQNRMTQIQWRDRSGVVSEGAEAIYLMTRLNQGEYVVISGNQPCNGTLITSSVESILMGAAKLLDEHMRTQQQQAFNDEAFSLFDQVGPATTHQPLAPFALVPNIRQALERIGLTPSVAQIMVRDALTHHGGTEIGGQWTVPLTEAGALILRIEKMLPAKRLAAWQAERNRLSIN